MPLHEEAADAQSIGAAVLDEGAGARIADDLSTRTGHREAAGAAQGISAGAAGAIAQVECAGHRIGAAALGEGAATGVANVLETVTERLPPVRL